MSENMAGFIIWCVCGCFFVCLGIYSLFSNKSVPLGFWANVKPFEVTDIKKYNSAMAKMYCVFGTVFILFGLPLLAGQNSALIVLSIVGPMIETIVMMAIYTTVIERKYRRKK